MNLELDHIFILVEPEAHVANELVSLGLTESFSRDHTGQGTSNRRFEFSNGVLEFLWIRDSNEANNGSAKKLLLPQRRSNPTASPFGIIVNKKDKSDQQKPFNGWKYQPDYFQAPMAFLIGNNSSKLTEPLCIYAPFIEPNVRHTEKGMFKSISKVCVYTPETSFSDTLKSVKDSDRLAVESDDNPHWMELTLDENRLGMSKDFRPEIPLVLHW